MKNILIMALLVFNTALFSQSMLIKNVYTENYPTIKADVYFYDDLGKSYTTLTNDQIKITDGGLIRPVTNKFCDLTQNKFSITIVADFSQSMKLEIEPGLTRFKALLNSMTALVDLMPFGRSELSIVQFGGGADTLIGFSQNPADIKNIINKSINFPLNATTDFNAAFLGRKDPSNNFAGYGGIQQSYLAKWKPFILFFSDGDHNFQGGDEKVNFNRIKDSCLANGITVYSAQFGGSAPNSIDQIVKLTGGKTFASLTTQADISKAFQDILDEVDKNPAALPPCEVEWLADCNGGDLVMEATIQGVPVSSSFTYTIPANLKPILQVSDPNPELLNGTSKQITLTAKNNNVTITNAMFSDTRFSITENMTNFVLTKDVPKTININFTSDGDDRCSTTDIDFTSNACSGNETKANVGFLKALDVFVGATTVGTPITNRKAYFTNNTCKQIQITNIRTSDNAVFPFAFTTNITVGAGQTKDIDFQYVPSGVGTDEADLFIRVNGIEYQSKISGSSAGQASIETAIAGNNPVTKCQEKQEITVSIENVGPIDMNVTDLVLSNTTDFALKAGTQTSFTVPKKVGSVNGKVDVVVEFSSITEGTKNTNLTITNSSENEPIKVEALSAKRANVQYAGKPVNLGNLCPNEVKNFKIEIDETGEIPSKITLTSNQSSVDFSIAGNVIDFTVGPDKTRTLDLALDAAQLPAGDFSVDVILLDECGDQQGTTTITGTIEQATTEYNISVYDYNANTQVISIPANLNVSSPFNLTLKNTSTKDLSNIKPTLADNYGGALTINDVGSDKTATAGGTYQVAFNFTPDQSISYIIDLRVTAEVNGVQCLDEDLVDIVAGVDLETVAFSTNDASALIGKEFEITGLTFAPANSPFFTAGINSVEMEVTVDNTLMESLDGVPSRSDNPGETIYTYIIDPANPQNLKFKALDPKNPNVVSNAIKYKFIKTNPAGRGLVTTEDALFTLQRAKSEIEVTDVSGKPGDKIKLVLSASNLVGIDPAFHQEISGKLTFNGTLLYPTGTTPLGNLIKNGTDVRREIDFVLPLLSTGKKGGFEKQADNTVEFEFITLLGNSIHTEFNITNVQSKNGVIDIVAKVGNFTLLGVCESPDGSSIRLFDPTEDGTLINIKGEQPISGLLEINISNFEDGQHHLSLYDINGFKLYDLFKENLDRNGKQIFFDSNLLIDGVYYLNLQTPSQLITEKIIIIK